MTAVSTGFTRSRGREVQFSLDIPLLFALEIRVVLASPLVRAFGYRFRLGLSRANSNRSAHCSSFCRPILIYRHGAAISPRRGWKRFCHLKSNPKKRKYFSHQSTYLYSGTDQHDQLPAVRAPWSGRGASSIFSWISHSTRRSAQGSAVTSALFALVPDLFLRR
jgi:hypothetical protein